MADDGRSSSMSRRENHYDQQRHSFKSQTSHSRPQSLQSRPTSYQHYQSFRSRGGSLMSTDAANNVDEYMIPDELPDEIETSDRRGVSSVLRSSRSSVELDRPYYDVADDEGRRPSTRHSRRRSGRTSAHRPNTSEAIVEALPSIRPENGVLDEEASMWYGKAENPSSTLPAMSASQLADPPLLQTQRQPQQFQKSDAVTQLYAVFYLVLFSMLGTLARLGLQSLTFYPGAPVTTGVLWANFTGCLIMGFLVNNEEVRSHNNLIAAGQIIDSRMTHENKQTPLYVGLTTGFCGSLTSFSSFMRDGFLALSNDLSTPSLSSIDARHDGYSVLALPAVLITTTCVSIAAHYLGTHLALIFHSLTFSSRSTKISSTSQLFVTLLNILALLVAISSWTALLILTILPPSTSWRTHRTLLFSLLLSPPGCLLRYLLAHRLNTLRSSLVSPAFPLGTFAANLLGTVILGTAFVLQRVRIAEADRLLACQALQGLQEGFCGALTTVSAWVAELVALAGGRWTMARRRRRRRRNGRDDALRGERERAVDRGEEGQKFTAELRDAYIYGLSSLVAGIALLVVIMGSVEWSVGWTEMVCRTGI